MNIPIQHIEEELNVAYASAVIAKANFTFDIVRRDYGVDLAIRRIASFNGTRMDMGVIVDCQLKASINWSLEKENIVYDIESAAYNKMVFRREQSATPCILVLLCLPKDKTQWLHITEEQLTLRKCCYWNYITGSPTGNKQKIRIRIPRNQVFTPQQVQGLVSKVISGSLQ